MADDELGLPDDLGLPEEKEDVGLPDDLGLPDDVGLSEEPAPPEDVLPDDLGMPEDVGMPDELGSPEEAKEEPSGELGAQESSQEQPEEQEEDDVVGDLPPRRSSEDWQAEAEKKLHRGTKPGRPSTRPNSVDEAIRKSLFGGQAKKSQHEDKPVEKPRSTISAEERKDIQKRIMAPKPPPQVPALDQDCTFKPLISEASKAMGDKGSSNEPRYVVLATENLQKKQKHEQKCREKEQKEMAACPFQPEVHHDQAFAHVTAKFLEKKTRPEAVPEEIPKPAPKPKSLFTPQPRDVGEHKGEGAHMARAQTARDLTADRHSRLVRPLDESQWQGRRQTTTPQPFCSHTGMRKTLREQEKQGPAVEKISEKMFKELHKQLHSLDLGGPQW